MTDQASVRGRSAEPGFPAAIAAVLRHRAELTRSTFDTHMPGAAALDHAANVVEGLPLDDPRVAAIYVSQRVWDGPYAPGTVEAQLIAGLAGATDAVGAETFITELALAAVEQAGETARAETAEVRDQLVQANARMERLAAQVQEAEPLHDRVDELEAQLAETASQLERSVEQVDFLKARWLDEVKPKQRAKAAA